MLDGIDDIWKTPTSANNSHTEALKRAAGTLGVDPLDLATIIGFETGGTYDPHKVGGEGGKYKGLIQFGQPEQQKYYRPGQTFENQVEDGVVRYFQDRFNQVGKQTKGATLEDLYTTVIAGNPTANRDVKDSFGTSARSGTARMLKEHRPQALSRFFQSDVDSVFGDAGSQTNTTDSIWNVPPTTNTDTPPIQPSPTVPGAPVSVQTPNPTAELEAQRADLVRDLSTAKLPKKKKQIEASITKLDSSIAALKRDNPPAQPPAQNPYIIAPLPTDDGKNTANNQIIQTINEARKVFDANGQIPPPPPLPGQPPTAQPQIETLPQAPPIRPSYQPLPEGMSETPVYQKRDLSTLKDGETYYPFEKTGKDSAGRDYLGTVDGEHRFRNSDGDEIGYDPKSDSSRVIGTTKKAYDSKKNEYIRTNDQADVIDGTRYEREGGNYIFGTDGAIREEYPMTQAGKTVQNPTAQKTRTVQKPNKTLVTGAKQGGQAQGEIPSPTESKETVESGDYTNYLKARKEKDSPEIRAEYQQLVKDNPEVYGTRKHSDITRKVLVPKGVSVRDALKDATRKLVYESGIDADAQDIDAAIENNPIRLESGERATDSYLEQFRDKPIPHTLTADFFADVLAAKKQRLKKESITTRINSGELQGTQNILQTMKDEGLISAEQQTELLDKENKIQAEEDVAKERYEASQPNDLANTPYSDSYEERRKLSTVVPQSEIDRAQTDAEAAKKDRALQYLEKYGSYVKGEKETTRIAKEYQGQYRPLARPIEFAKNFYRAVPQAAAAILKTSDIFTEVNPISATNIYHYFTGTETDATKGYAYKLGKAIEDFTDNELIPKNKDLQGETLVEAGNVLGQVAVQLGVGALTGGATVPVLLGLALGASQQYDEAVKKGATPNARRLAAIIGGVAAVSDAIPLAKFLSPLQKAGRIGFVSKFLSSIFGGVAKEVGEKEAVEITRGALRNLLVNASKKGLILVKGAGLEGTQELTEKKINDAVAAATYNPKRKVFVINDQDLAEFFGGAIGGVGGGAFQIALENRVEAENQTGEITQPLQSEVQQTPTNESETSVEAKTELQTKPQARTETETDFDEYFGITPEVQQPSTPRAKSAVEKVEPKTEIKDEAKVSKPQRLIQLEVDNPTNLEEVTNELKRGQYLDNGALDDAYIDFEDGKITRKGFLGKVEELAKAEGYEGLELNETDKITLGDLNNHFQQNVKVETPPIAEKKSKADKVLPEKAKPKATFLNAAKKVKTEALETVTPVADTSPSLEGVAKIENPTTNDGKKIVGFKTAKGSTYTVNGSSTQRNKSLHTDSGHEPTDVGLKKPSAVTYYGTQIQARLFTFAGEEKIVGNDNLIRVTPQPDGTVKAEALRYNSVQKKWFNSSKTYPDISPVLTTTPKVGLHPIELWTPQDKGDKSGIIGYRGTHGGNAITELVTESGNKTTPTITKGNTVTLPADKKTGEVKTGIVAAVGTNGKKVSVKVEGKEQIVKVENVRRVEAKEPNGDVVDPIIEAYSKNPFGHTIPPGSVIKANNQEFLVVGNPNSSGFNVIPANSELAQQLRPLVERKATKEEINKVLPGWYKKLQAEQSYLRKDKTKLVTRIKTENKDVPTSTPENAQASSADVVSDELVKGDVGAKKKINAATLTKQDFLNTFTKEQQKTITTEAIEKSHEEIVREQLQGDIRQAENSFKHIKAFTFEELSPKAKKRALNVVKEGNPQPPEFFTSEAKGLDWTETGDIYPDWHDNLKFSVSENVLKDYPNVRRAYVQHYGEKYFKSTTPTQPIAKNDTVTLPADKKTGEVKTGIVAAVGTNGKKVSVKVEGKEQIVKVENVKRVEKVEGKVAPVPIGKVEKVEAKEPYKTTKDVLDRVKQRDREEKKTIENWHKEAKTATDAQLQDAIAKINSYPQDGLHRGGELRKQIITDELSKRGLQAKQPAPENAPSSSADVKGEANAIQQHAIEHFEQQKLDLDSLVNDVKFRKAVVKGKTLKVPMVKENGDPVMSKGKQATENVPIKEVLDEIKERHKLWEDLVKCVNA